MKIQKNIAQEFNEFSKNYTNDMIGCVPHYLDLLSSCTEHLPENYQPNTILDLGCGNGNVTKRLLERYPESQYTLVDASLEMIDLCRKQFDNFNCRFANSYFKDFSFERDSYDLITAGFSFHHCDSEEKQFLFSEIYAALKKGGIFSSCDLMINKSNPDHPALLLEWQAFVNSNFADGEKWSWIMDHYDAFDKPDNYFDQVKWLKVAGFKNISHPFKIGYWTHLQAIKN